MPAPIILSRRDHRLLDTLGFRVRLLSLSQVSRGFFGGDDRYASRRVERLSVACVLVRRSLVVRTAPVLDAPVVRWNAGSDAPDFASISAFLIDRWQKQETAITNVVSLGTAARKLTGRSSGMRIKHPHQVGHDLALSEVFLRYLDRAPEIAGRWVGEDRLDLLTSTRGKAKQAVPDAVIQNADGAPELAIELGGLYSPARIETLHQSFAKQELSYEIW